MVAPFAGKVVAARNGPENGAIGSTNFVLLQHSIKIGREQLDFYSFYMHLKQEPRGLKPEKRLKWMTGRGWDDKDTSNTIDIMNPAEAVGAGEVIGHVGKAGPEHTPQIHFEIFAIDNGAVSRLDKEKFWNLVPGDTDRRFCTQKPILDLIDTEKKDGQISDDELADFYHNTDGDRETETTHHIITHDYSEWSWMPGVGSRVLSSPEAEARFHKLKPKGDPGSSSRSRSLRPCGGTTTPRSLCASPPMRWSTITTPSASSSG